MNYVTPPVLLTRPFFLRSCTASARHSYLSRLASNQDAILDGFKFTSIVLPLFLLRARESVSFALGRRVANEFPVPQILNLSAHEISTYRYEEEKRNTVTRVIRSYLTSNWINKKDLLTSFRFTVFFDDKIKKVIFHDRQINEHTNIIGTRVAKNYRQWRLFGR